MAMTTSMVMATITTSPQDSFGEIRREWQRRKRRQMGITNAVSVLMVIVGVIAGPIYYFYCDSFSGKKVGTFYTGDQPGLDLDPQMNPVSIGVTLYPSGLMDQYYVASLHLDNRRIAATSTHVSSDATASSFTLAQINVPRAGTYHFKIEPSRPGLKLLGVKYNVRRNTKVANLMIVLTGVVVFFLGCILNATEARYREEMER